MRPRFRGVRVGYLLVAAWTAFSAFGTVWFLSRGEDDPGIVVAYALAAIPVGLVIVAMVARSRPGWTEEDADSMRARLRSLLKWLAIGGGLLLVGLVVWLMGANNM